MALLGLFHEPRQLLLDMAQEHELAELLPLVVNRIADSPRVALARIWLKERSTDCTHCVMAEICPDRSLCLHLVASAGQSLDVSQKPWTKLNGRFRRFPLGVKKVGLIGATGEAVEIPDLNEEKPAWLADPEWIESEEVTGFGGQPLIHRGEILGVLVVFARGSIGAECMDWLRTIANHTAAAIGIARAFDEIARLQHRLKQENEYLREEVGQIHSYGEMVGHSPALRTVTRQIDLVASTDSAVLILGESGTGKELVAREIHRRSRRADQPLIKVNCAAVPRELYESEFFGHAKGAFTGALRDRTGRFELADGGTLFLDEVGEIPLDLQAKLLRVLQEGELERIGEERTRNVNVRVITATNRNLKAEAEAGRFRLDLYYRLSVFPIELPPLRMRPEDIPLLAEYFLAMHARKLGRPVPLITLGQMQKLQAYTWPGNIRELQHTLERALITATNGRLQISFPESATEGKAPQMAIENNRVLSANELLQLEIDNIRRALQAAQGKVSGPGGAAELLGMKPTTLASRIKALKIGE